MALKFLNLARVFDFCLRKKIQVNLLKSSMIESMYRDPDRDGVAKGLQISECRSSSGAFVRLVPVPLKELYPLVRRG